METNENQNASAPLPETAIKQTPPRPRKPLTLFKKIVIVIFCVVSSFGVYDLFFPSKTIAPEKTTPQPSPTEIAAPQKEEWKTYLNKNHHYAIAYPPDWTYREFPNTQSGAGFRLASKPDDLCCETITIDYMPKMENAKDLSFEKYVQVAGQGIQGFENIQSSQKITTDSGIVGYTTTWNVQSLDGKQTISAPLTFFPVKDDPDGIITVSVVDPKDPIQITTYNDMLKTFSYK